jgi:two-component system response regulator AgrA
MNIIVCEDSEKQRIDIVKHIDNIIRENYLNMKVYLSTENPYDVIKSIKDTPELSVYILDVDLKCNINGIELADKIRDKDPYSFIIFITSHSEMTHLTFKYKVEAFDYIIKNSREELHRGISDALLKINMRLGNSSLSDSFFTIEDGRSITKIDFRDILFFETTSIKSKIKVNCFNRSKEFYSKLKDIEQSLDERFIKCHKSFIVNIDNIQSINKKEKLIYMRNGQTCCLSKSYTKALLDKLKL